MADLNALLAMNPGAGSFMIGQQNQSDLATALAKQQEIQQLIQARQQQQAFEAQNQPGLFQHQQLVNQGLEQGLPGITADAVIKGQTARKGEATLDSDIEATKATNKGLVNKSNYEQYQRAEQVLLDAGPVLANTPPALRAQALRDHISNAGMNPDAGQFRTIMNMDANQMPGAVNALAQAVGQQRLALDPQAQGTIASANIHASAERDTAKTRAAAEVQSAGIHAEGAKAAATISSDGRMEVQRLKIEQKLKSASDTLTLVKQGKIPPDRALLMAKSNYPDAATDQERQAWLDVATTAENVIKLKAQAAGEGQPGLRTDDKGNVTGLTPKSVPSVSAGMGKKPTGTGTAADPIKLD